MATCTGGGTDTGNETAYHERDDNMASQSATPDVGTPHNPLYLGRFNVRLADDKYTPAIYGSTVLADGTVVITDHVNDKVKVLNGTSYKVKQHACTHRVFSPWGVCATGPNEICIAQHCELIFFNVKPNLERLFHFHNIYVRRRCSAVAFSEGCVYVGCGRGYTNLGRQWGGDYVEEAGEVQAFTRTGKRLHSWELDCEDKPIFTRPWCIAVSPDGARIHVADEINGVMTFTKMGEIVGRVEEPDPAWCQALCVGPGGHVFACGYSTGDVLLLDPDGHRLGTVLTSSDGIRYPTSVCYDPSRRRLIVGMLGDNIAVYQV